MRHLFGMLIVGGLSLGTASVAKAQDQLNAWGSYPTRFAPVTPYGVSSSGYYGRNLGGLPRTTPWTTYAPGTSYYNSPYVPPGTRPYSYIPGPAYGSMPTSRPYPTYGYSYAPGYGYYSYYGYTQRPGPLRAGLFRRNP